MREHVKDNRMQATAELQYTIIYQEHHCSTSPTLVIAAWRALRYAWCQNVVLYQRDICSTMLSGCHPICCAHWLLRNTYDSAGDCVLQQ